MATVVLDNDGRMIGHWYIDPSDQEVHITLSRVQASHLKQGEELTITIKENN